ncbi:hypothetical protein EVAR_96188_1 [Eumeta japonica]|uniref:Uncharacterized protein n=1 Tax=Eumeta variegata TaxID=151549 RepID=A0A4C1VI19_EUMVA|nr:hypothetical protein EVAR_96188_1 [Eumeta japonica]
MLGQHQFATPRPSGIRAIAVWSSVSVKRYRGKKSHILSRLATGKEVAPGKNARLFGLVSGTKSELFIQGLLMELEGGHRNSVIKRRNPIGLGSFVLTVLWYYMVTSLMMELEGGHRNSVIKRRNPIEFGLV